MAKIAAMKFLLKAAAAWVLASAGVAFAQALPPSEPPAADPASVAGVSTEQAPIVLPEERRWRLGAAVGMGERSNPLIQSKDIPLFIDIDIAYFGDHWFFDNGDLGLHLMDNDVATTNLVARVNSDRAFFGKTNTRYVTFSLMAGGTTGALFNPATGQPVTTEVDIPPQPLKPPKRDYAIEAGIESLFGGDWGQASFRAFHDVSGTHDGYEIAADYSHRFTHGLFSWSPMVGVSWKSASLSNYYWGVHSDEVSFTLRPYEAEAGLGWEAGLRANYYMTKSLRLALSANYERLQHSVAMSPLVKQDYVVGYFMGLGWQF
jgi:outer membrane protein